MHQRGEKTSRYLIRVCHMRQLKSQVAALHRKVSKERQQVAQYESAMVRSAAYSSRMFRLALVALVACPGSFVLGGFYATKVASWLLACGGSHVQHVEGLASMDGSLQAGPIWQPIPLQGAAMQTTQNRYCSIEKG